MSSLGTPSTVYRVCSSPSKLEYPTRMSERALSIFIGPLTFGVNRLSLQRVRQSIFIGRPQTLLWKKPDAQPAPHLIQCAMAASRAAATGRSASGTHAIPVVEPSTTKQADGVWTNSFLGRSEAQPRIISPSSLSGHVKISPIRISNPSTCGPHKTLI